MTTELLPCPFCGEEAELRNDFDEDGRWCTWCPNCGCGGAFCRQQTNAVAAWNKRAPLPSAESEPRLIVDEPDDFGIIRIWPFGREPYLASVDVHPHDPFANEEWEGYSIFYRGHLSTIENTRRYAQALLKACEVAEGMNRQRQEADAQKGESNE